MGVDDRGLIRELLLRKSLSARRHRSALGSVCGLTEAEVTAVFISRARDMTAGELGRALLFTTGGTSALLRRLDGRGWTVRTGDPADRRVVIVSLARERPGKLESMLAELIEEEDAILDAFADLQPSFAEMLRALAECQERHTETALAAAERHVAPQALPRPGLWA